MKKVDVAVNVYGKPYHTLISILSLLKYSKQHIGKIFLLEEPEHPHGDNIDNIFQFLPSEIIIHKKLKHGHCVDYNNEEYRHSIRYQYAFEKTDKDYLFIMHNDVLFKGDTIGGMLQKIEETQYVGIGTIGQCWNCPAYYAKVCNGDIMENYNPTYEEAIEVVEKYPGPRTNKNNINKESPMPFPECRLNEFFALLNIKILKHLIRPIGNITPIGVGSIDTGTDFFRELFMKGYRFINYAQTGHIETEDVKHGWVTQAGTPSNKYKDEYERIEYIAKDFFFKNYN